ncbi:MAG TPA: SGNH/GDSL hydrolase family protein [Agriterribacter sp.]|nr:SGNH/GDSL hydrolase family protein [Agriterribacter sp.]
MIRSIFFILLFISANASCQRVKINDGNPTSVTINAPGQSPSVRIPNPNNNSTNTTEDGRQLLVIIGNSIARGTSNGEGPTPTTGTVYEWNGSSIVQVGSNDLINAVTGSQWPQMGINYNTASGYKLVFTNSGSGGADFADPGDNNYWATGGTLYPAMKTKTNNALSNMGLTSPRAIFVICGINDARASTPLEDVQAAIADVFDKIEADWPTARVYVVNIGRDATGISTVRINAVRSYLESEVAARANFVMAFDLRIFAEDFPEYYAADNLHLNQTGCNALGVILAAYLDNN